MFMTLKFQFDNIFFHIHENTRDYMYLQRSNERNRGYFTVHVHVHGCTGIQNNFQELIIGSLRNNDRYGDEKVTSKFKFELF